MKDLFCMDCGYAWEQRTTDCPECASTDIIKPETDDVTDWSDGHFEGDMNIPYLKDDAGE